MPETVRAAGGVLWRPAGDGLEICVVRRPAYGDWSLPKGKLDDDEHPLLAAVREVLEETGFRGIPEVRLPDVTYDMPDGTPKTVEFWAMRVSGDPAVDVHDPDEVDEVRWLTPDAAADRLDYAADVELVRLVAELPPVTAITPIVRHANAGERKKWSGNDALRPLDDLGREQAARLVPVLQLFAPQRLVAATPLRCKQTLEPFAELDGLPIVSDSAFAEPPSADEVPAKVKVAIARLAVLRDGERVAICSQGKVMPPLIAALHDEEDPQPYKTPKGTGWILTWSGERLVAASRI